jgi:hypothetical protein
LFGEGSEAINQIGVGKLLLKESLPGMRNVHDFIYSKYSRLELCSLLRLADQRIVSSSPCLHSRSSRTDLTGLKFRLPVL